MDHNSLTFMLLDPWIPVVALTDRVISPANAHCLQRV